jgi:hypothetical protein
MTEIINEYMSLTVDDKVAGTAEFSQHAVGDGNGMDRLVLSPQERGTARCASD